MTTLARHTKSIQKTPRRTRPAQRVAVAPFAKGCIGPTSTKPRMQSPRTDTAGDFFLKGLLLDTKLFCLYIYALKAQLLSSTNFHQHTLIGGSSGVYWHIPEFQDQLILLSQVTLVSHKERMTIIGWTAWVRGHSTKLPLSSF